LIVEVAHPHKEEDTRPKKTNGDQHDYPGDSTLQPLVGCGPRLLQPFTIASVKFSPFVFYEKCTVDGVHRQQDSTDRRVQDHHLRGEWTITELRGGLEPLDGGLKLLDVLSRSYGWFRLRKRDKIQCVPGYHVDQDPPQEQTLKNGQTRGVRICHGHDFPIARIIVRKEKGGRPTPSFH
jgi:hypothetical protein